MHNRQELANLEGLLPVGEPVTLAVQREGKKLSIKVRLAPRVTELTGVDLDVRLDGILFGVLPERLRRQGMKGVLVVNVVEGSRASVKGLRAGDLVTAVNRSEVADLATLELSLSPRPEKLVLTLVRGGRAYFALME